MAHARAGYMERYTKSLAKQAVAEYAAIAKKHGLTPTELALAWCKGKWQVASTIIGATSMEQLKVRAFRCPRQVVCMPCLYGAKHRHVADYVCCDWHKQHGAFRGEPIAYHYNDWEGRESH